MAKRARILGERLLHSGRFPLTQTRVEVEETGGGLREIEYEIYRYGRAGAVLLYDPARGCVLFVRQFRLGAFLDDGTLDTLEVAAGMLDGDTAQDGVRREAEEETGFRVGAMTHAFDAFSSPSGITERLCCFVAPYSPADRVGAGCGVDDDEHIEIVEMSAQQALDLIDSGGITDVKTIALLLWARSKRLI